MRGPMVSNCGEWVSLILLEQKIDFGFEPPCRDFAVRDADGF